MLWKLIITTCLVIASTNAQQTRAKAAQKPPPPVDPLHDRLLNEYDTKPLYPPPNPQPAQRPSKPVQNQPSQQPSKGFSVYGFSFIATYDQRDQLESIRADLTIADKRSPPVTTACNAAAGGQYLGRPLAASLSALKGTCTNSQYAFAVRYLPVAGDASTADFGIVLAHRSGTVDEYAYTTTRQKMPMPVSGVATMIDLGLPVRKEWGSQPSQSLIDAALSWKHIGPGVAQVGVQRAGQGTSAPTQGTGPDSMDWSYTS
ncbi:hypothetical protein C1H76_1373 [Elsinoe australis]|uniref:Uncharacterized protein n=1 Tax=Elsinoe australis TaxID=40998 RepID=A0A4U7B996_9PEZI|nr:hypothetical protein C1H76_1373 [Elsinoe australis]